MHSRQNESNGWPASLVLEGNATLRRRSGAAAQPWGWPRSEAATRSLSTHVHGRTGPASLAGWGLARAGACAPVDHWYKTSRLLRSFAPPAISYSSLTFKQPAHPTSRLLYSYFLVLLNSVLGFLAVYFPVFSLNRQLALVTLSAQLGHWTLLAFQGFRDNRQLLTRENHHNRQNASQGHLSPRLDCPDCCLTHCPKARERPYLWCHASSPSPPRQRRW